MAQYWNYWNKLLTHLRTVEAIQEPTERQTAIADFAAMIAKDYSKGTEFFIERITELESDIELLNVPESLMDSLKEALFCYINGQYLSSIAATGITAELFCVHLYSLFLRELDTNRINVKKRLKSFQRINQSEKIEILYSVVGISREVCDALHEIRKRRNGAVHPGEGYNYQADALDALQTLIDVLNMYSASQKQAMERAQGDTTTTPEHEAPPPNPPQD